MLPGNHLEVPLSGEGIDRAEDRRSDDEWLARARSSRTALSVVVEGCAGVLIDDAPALAMVEGPVPGSGDIVLLGILDGVAVFGREAANPRAASSHRFADLREVGPDLAARDAVLAAQTLGLLNWHRGNRYCGMCGGPTTVSKAGYSRRCEDCAETIFPRTDPAVIMLPVAGASALLCRRVGRAHWSCLAGFIEPGEGIEAAVAREVSEETGLTTTGVAYLGSQAWPFPGQVMLGFQAEVQHDEVTLNEELEEFRWWERDELSASIKSGETGLASPLSIGRALVERWAGLRQEEIR